MDRQIKTFAMATAFTLLAAGFAYAVPVAMHLAAAHGDDVMTADDELTSDVEIGLDPSPSPSPTSSPTADDEGDSKDARLRRDNHGRAVSAAARCKVKGRAHGNLVRSIAEDRNATVADAEAACEAAKAEAGPSTSPGKKSRKPDNPNAGGGKGQAQGRTPDVGHAGGGNSAEPGDDAPPRPEPKGEPRKPSKPPKPDRPNKSSRP